MPTLTDIRQQYPQYSDMSDASLADAMYNKYYPDMPRDQFNAKIGYSDVGSGVGVEAAQGLSMGDQAHLGTVPTEAAKGVPVAGALVPDTADTKQFEEQQPTAASLTRGVGSALATAPFMAMAPEIFGLKAGAGLIGNTLRAGGTGAVMGAADAAARGEPIVQGAEKGALTLGAAPVVGRVLGPVMQKVASFLTPEATGVLQGFDPKALEIASNAMKSSGMTEQQIAQKITQLGPERILAEYNPELYGQAVGVAGSAGEAAGPGKQAIQQAFESRVTPGAQKARIEEGLDNLLGKPLNMTQAGIENAAQREKEAGPLFDQFRDMKVTPTPAVKQLTQELDDAGYLKLAQQKAAQESLATGQPVAPTQDFFTTGAQKDWPTTKSWAYVKQAVDDKIANSYDGMGNPTQDTRMFRQLKKRIDDTIANSSPETAKVWNQARDIWENSKAIDNARAEGLNAWNPRYNPDQMAQDVTDMSQAERNAYKEGSRAALRDKLIASANGDKSVRNLLVSDAAKQKLHFLAENKKISADAIDQFLTTMRREPEFVASQKNLKTSTEKEAINKGISAVTPKPEELPINRMREKYSPHVQPFSYGSKGLANYFERRQAEKMSQTAGSLGKLLANKNTKADEIARALLNYRGTPLMAQPALTASGAAAALARPSTPNLPTPPFKF